MLAFTRWWPYWWTAKTQVLMTTKTAIVKLVQKTEQVHWLVWQASVRTDKPVFDEDISMIGRWSDIRGTDIAYVRHLRKYKLSKLCDVFVLSL